MCGGGSGGHVTPIRSVISELKKLDAQAEVHFVGQRGDSFAQLLMHEPDIASSHFIFAGKFRRYVGIPWYKQLLHFKTVFFNLRDLIFIGLGTLESLYIMARLKPDAVFLKGGYVCVPVGVAAKLLSRPFITHDSDVIAYLSNKIVGRWAHKNTVASELGTYPYPSHRQVVVGVPIDPMYHQKSTLKDIASYRKELAVTNLPQVLVVGGGNGAQAINEALLYEAEALSKECEVHHIVGERNIEAVQERLSTLALSHPERYHVIDLVRDKQQMYKYYALADIVVSRAGATSIAEIAALGKTAIVIPSNRLADQMRYAPQLADQDAALVLSDEDIEQDPKSLLLAIDKLRTNRELALRLATNVRKFARPHAARDIATMLAGMVGKQSESK